MMKTILLIFIGAVVILSNSTLAEDSKSLNFSGEGNGASPVFTIAGPWTIDWSANSEFPLLTSIEIMLHDGTTGRVIGRVAELEGIGRGLKLLEESGAYRIVVTGREVSWRIEVLEIDVDQAATLQSGMTGGQSLLVSSRHASRLIPESSFVEWRPEGDDTLLLLNNDEIAWRISFSSDCPGLKSATTISFVTPAGKGESIDHFESILLENGTRCYFNAAIPGSAPAVTDR